MKKISKKELYKNKLKRDDPTIPEFVEDQAFELALGGHIPFIGNHEILGWYVGNLYWSGGWSVWWSEKIPKDKLIDSNDYVIVDTK